MNENQFNFIGYIGSMIGCYKTMPQKEKDALFAWEKEHIDGSGEYTTSDWPGWEKYIGKRPLQKEKEVDYFGYVYLMKCGEQNYKIGIAKNIKNRLQQLQTGNPLNIKLIHSFPSKNARKSELKLHQKYSDFKIRNEWFSLKNEHISEICQINKE